MTACSKSSTVSVGIHGVNYSGEEITYSIEDPAKPDNRGGGENLTPYAAGGTLCCYDLPRTWQPGIKVQINLTRYLPRKEDGTLPEVKETHTVEVPSYANGKPGELWVLRNADGSVSALSTDYQPDHEKWPGLVKGWPVPSLEYQRKRWDLYIEHAEGGVRLHKKLLDELENSPDARANDAWEFAAKDAARYVEGMQNDANRFAKESKELIARYRGPTDPGFREWLRQDYEEGLRRSELQLKELKDARP